ncbi:MAG: SurA N-terminal domain-containing protein [Bacteroidota bacterium]|nr:SurA N-terminal domain-containing protein [Bacteroidota bacterium]
MALIGQLRQRAGWAIGVVAIGLGLFIVGGDVLSPNSVLRGNNERNVAEINGKKIPVERFEEELNEMRYTYYLNTEKTPGEKEMQQFIPQAWNQLIFEVAYQKEFDELGIVVGKEETIDMVQGRNVHPAIFQSFRNPTTGQFDRSLVINYLQNINRMEQKQQAIWFNFEKNLPADRIRSKYEALLKKTVYVTTAEARREFESQNMKASGQYVHIPYSIIPDNEVQITETAIEEYVNKNKAKYPLDASANIEYVTFPIIPARADTVEFLADINQTIQDFKKSEDDSMFSAVNADNHVPPSWMNPGELPEDLKTRSGFQKDSVYGPFITGGTYKIYKIMDMLDDTAYAAKASHILFRWNSESPEDKRKAMDSCRMVLNKIKKGASFEMMAARYGTDGTAQQGGDLGWFGQGRMVKEFQNAVFGATKKGLLDNPVETQFGYHIIKVTETKTNKKYQIAAVDKTITSGDETRDSVYQKAEQLSIQSRDAEGLDAYVKSNPNIVKLQAPNITASTPYINNLSNPKEIIRWIFTEAKEGQLSPIIEIDNQFVVAVLRNKYEKGKVNIEANKYQIVYQLTNELKGDKILEKIGAETNDLPQAAQKIGNNIQIQSAMAVSFSNPTLGNAGFEPEAIGKLFGMAAGASSKPIKGNSGVVLVRTNSVEKPGEIGDYSMYKNSIANMAANRIDYSINEAIKEGADVTDYKYKFY